MGYFAGTKKPTEGTFVEEPVPCISCKTPSVFTVGPAAVKVSMTGEESDAVVAAHLPCEFVYYKTPKVTSVSLEDEPVAEDAMIDDGPPPKKIVVIKGQNFAEAEGIKVAFWRSGVQVVVDGTLKGEKKSAKVTCMLPAKKDLPTAPKEEPAEPAETTTEEGAEPAPEDEKKEEEPAPEPVEEGPPLPLVVEVSSNNGIQFTENGVELELPE